MRRGGFVSGGTSSADHLSHLARHPRPRRLPSSSHSPSCPLHLLHARTSPLEYSSHAKGSGAERAKASFSGSFFPLFSSVLSQSPHPPVPPSPRRGIPNFIPPPSLSLSQFAAATCLIGLARREFVLKSPPCCSPLRTLPTSLAAANCRWMDGDVGRSHCLFTGALNAPWRGRRRRTKRMEH